MNIAFVCSEYPPGRHGGIGTMVQVLGRALVQAGHEVRVVGCYSSSLAGPECEEDQGVRVWRLRIPDHRLAWISERIKIYRVIAGWGRRGEIDVIEVPDYQGLAAGWPRMPVPIVGRLHGSLAYFAAEMNQSLRRVPFLLERASLRRVDYWCSVSRYTADKTQRIFQLRSGPTAVLYNPVEFPKNGGGYTRPNQMVVFSGTLALKKGVVPLFEAWSRVVEKCPGAELHVFGKDGRTAPGLSMRMHLESLLTPQARKSVFFYGHVDRKRLFEAYATARLAVFPSYAEAFAVAPLEAMACGCPTIYSSRGSGPELINHGQNGLLVDPDRVDEIADSVIALLSNDSLTNRLGEAGRDLIRRSFSIEAAVRKNVDLYSSCLDEFHRN